MEETIILHLINEAKEISKQAYAPYSQFLVGCAILLNDGKIVTGVNIENASFSVTLCAERTAMAQVITQGFVSEIKALAVVTKSSPPGFPCGICRQFLGEFLAPNVPIIAANFTLAYEITTMAEILPKAFNKHSLV
jgi:homotetrameric cytidine deaminase